GRAMREAERTGVNSIGIAATQALLLTGCRRNEVLSLPWAWLDPRARCIRFEDTKSGAQLRPIGIDAVTHLSGQARTKNSRWIFPADPRDGHVIGFSLV